MWSHPLPCFSISLLLVMDTKAVFAALYSVCEENATFFSGGAKGTQGDAARRLEDTMKLIQEHGRSLEPVVSGFAAVYHHFDFDPHVPANGYRSLVKVSCGMLVCVSISHHCSAENNISPRTEILSYQLFSQRGKNGSPAPLDIALFQGQSICFTD